MPSTFHLWFRIWMHQMLGSTVLATFINLFHSSLSTNETLTDHSRKQVRHHGIAKTMAVPIT